MITEYILAGLIGLLLAGIINIDFRKKDISPIRRVLSMAVNIILMICLCLVCAHYYGITYRFVIYAMLAVNLLYISNYDIREQAVSYEIIIVSVICALAVLIYNKDNTWWNYILSGIGYAAVFMLISRMTHSAIGIGDAFITGIIGLYLGFFHALLVVFYAFLLGGLISIVLFLMKKVSRQTTLPFVPFLTAGFIVSILL